MIGKPFLVGVTGGIGSGKSTFCRFLRARGRACLSADDIAKELMANNREVRRELRRKFGPELFRSDGSPDRRRLAAIVFRKKSRLRSLNAILHPRVMKEIRRRASSLPARRKRPYVLVDAPLIFEAGLRSFFDFTLLVDAPLYLRITRVHAGRRIPKAEILRRSRTQLPSTVKRRMADAVVKNTGSLQELRNAALFLDGVLLRRARTRNWSK